MTQENLITEESYWLPVSEETLLQHISSC